MWITIRSNKIVFLFFKNYFLFFIFISADARRAGRAPTSVFVSATALQALEEMSNFSFLIISNRNVKPARGGAYADIRLLVQACALTTCIISRSS